MDTSGIETRLGRTIRKLLEVRQEIRVSLSSWLSDIGLPIHFQEESGIVTFWSFEFSLLSKCQRGVRPLSRWDGELRLSLGSPQGIQTCLHLVRWKKSLNLSDCREIRPSFESGPLGGHSNWDRKHRVPLTHLLLRENFSWSACGKVAHFFSQR